MKKVLLTNAGGELGRVILRKLQNNGHQPIVLNGDVSPKGLEGICNDVDCVISISDWSFNQNGQFKPSNLLQLRLLREAIKGRVSEFVFIPLEKTYSTQRLIQRINKNLKSFGMKFSLIHLNHAVWDGVNKNKLS